ncbi:hypothetical protein BJX64DRAFT_289136 [Aspergillus heterothallicus]
MENNALICRIPDPHIRSPGPNTHTAIFSRKLFNITSFAMLEGMMEKFKRNVKHLSGLDVDPVMRGLRHAPGSAVDKEDARCMYVSMLVGFPRPLVFLDESPQVASGILDDLVGGVPDQPEGEGWEVQVVESEGHHAYVRLKWLETAVEAMERFPVGGGEGRVFDEAGEVSGDGGSHCGSVMAVVGRN